MVMITLKRAERVDTPEMLFFIDLGENEDASRQSAQSCATAPGESTHRSCPVGEEAKFVEGGRRDSNVRAVRNFRERSGGKECCM